MYNRAIEEFQKGLRCVPKAVPVGHGQELEKKVTAMKTHIAGAQDRYRVIYDLVYPRQDSNIATTTVSKVVPTCVSPKPSVRACFVSFLF